MTRVEDIRKTVQDLLRKYHAQQALLFGSYARGEQTELSDVDLIIYGGENFKLRDIFALAEDLREALRVPVDCFEITEVDPDSQFYKTIITEGVRIAC